MRAEGDPRTVAGTTGDATADLEADSKDSALIERVEILEQRQAKVLEAVKLVAQGHGALARALQGILAD